MSTMTERGQAVQAPPASPCIAATPSLALSLLTAVLLTVGIAAPAAVSSLAVLLMMIALPVVIVAVLVRRRRAFEQRFIRANVILALLFVTFAAVGQWRGGLAYPSYLVSIGIHQAFFACCLLLLGAEGIWKAFKIAACVNLLFVAVQMVGGLVGNTELVSLSFLGVMKGSIEYWSLLPRASGLMTEPAHLSYLLLPALLVTLFTGRRGPAPMRRGRWPILVGYLLTLSFVAYLQLAIALLVYNIRRMSLKTMLLTLCGLAVLGAAYTSIPFARDRIAGAVALFDGEATDQSSVFAIQSNALVTAASLEESPLLGRGLTSHRQTYEHIIDVLFDFPIDDAWQGLNKDDAGSLLLLLLSESGFIGLLIFATFVAMAAVRTARIPGALGVVALAHLLTFAVVGLRYGQLASVHFMLNLQVVLYCLALAGASRAAAGRVGKRANHQDTASAPSTGAP